ncbi:MAG: alpha/beta fold hydrolase [Nitrososphaera sp.]|jgi:class III poly(R)-hydroxyalkanoic acid synthase PhaC subunit
MTEIQLTNLPINGYDAGKLLNAPQVWYNYYRNWSEFAQKYGEANFEATMQALQTAFTPGAKKSIEDIQGSMRAAYGAKLSERLNDETMTTSLASAVDSWADVLNLMDHNQISRSYSDLLSFFSRQLEPFRDTVNRTPSEVIEMEGRFNLLHYKSKVEPKHKTPILVIYSLINRYYILDLLPENSVINNLLNQGFDIYATDWGTPMSYDKDLTLENYSEQYVGNAVKKIKEITGADKVSLFGYCWGGLFTLVYSAMHPENVNALILHATPVDIQKGATIIEHWTSHLDADNLVKACGNVPGWILNAAFLLRNPVEAALKYPRYFSRPRTIEETLEFFSIEAWLYDSPPIIGEVYREIVDQVYRQNLLIKNKMQVGGKNIDLSKVAMPVLDIVGKTDDLVPPQSSRSVIDVIGSKDKRLIEFPIGHVGLCTSQQAHEKLWPEVGKWLAQRS